MEPLQVAEEVVESSPNKLEDIYRLLAEGSFPSSFCSIKKKNLKRYARKFMLEDGCLYYIGPKNEEKREVLVDPERRHHVFLESHLTQSGHHLGQKKTVNRIQSRYYWLGVVKDVIEWIKVCETCQNADYHKYPSKKCKPVKVDYPWEILGLSLHGPFSPSSQLNTYVITVTDFFTKWTEAAAVPRNDVVCVAKVLASIYYRFGAAKNIYSNQTCDFCEEVSKLLCNRWNIRQTLTAVQSCEYTGLDEQSYDLLKSSLKRVVNNYQKDWDEHLDPILFHFRTMSNPVTKQTPFFLMFNRNIHSSSTNEAVEESNGNRNSQNDGKNNSFVQRATVRQMATYSCDNKSERKPVQKYRRRPQPAMCPSKEEEFASVEDQALKKFKHSHIVPFKFESVLPLDENAAVLEKTSDI